jgi:serine phosphatase RsbU (regulator of sigma subunit)
MEDAKYQSSEILLSPGDLLLLYTDGLIEVQSPNSDLYTQQLLQSAVQRLLNDPAPKLFDALLDEVREFSGGAPFSDDVCLVGLEVSPQQK